MLQARIYQPRREFALDAALDLSPGETLGITGASGAGKTTLLDGIAGIFASQPPSYVRWQGQDWRHLPLYRRPFNYMRQNSRLFPHLSVEKNAAFGLPPARQRSREDTEWLEELRERLELDAIWSAAASEVSGGQARRAVWARTLARRLPLVLLDEPFADLDAAAGLKLLSCLKEWQRRWEFSLIVVDHDAQRLYEMAGQPRVLEAGRWA